MVWRFSLTVKKLNYIKNCYRIWSSRGVPGRYIGLNRKCGSLSSTTASTQHPPRNTGKRYGMFTSIESLRFDYRESQIELLEIQRAIDETTDQIHVMRLEVRRDRENYKLASMYAEASDRLREVALWARLKAEALEADPNINVEDVSEHQWETMHRVLLNRQASIGAGSGQAEIINVRGPLLTMDRARAYGADLKNWWAGVEEEQKAAIEAKAAEKQADS